MIKVLFGTFGLSGFLLMSCTTLLAGPSDGFPSCASVFTGMASLQVKQQLSLVSGGLARLQVSRGSLDRYNGDLLDPNVLPKPQGARARQARRYVWDLLLDHMVLGHPKILLGISRLYLDSGLIGGSEDVVSQLFAVNRKGNPKSLEELERILAESTGEGILKVNRRRLAEYVDQLSLDLTDETGSLYIPDHVDEQGITGLELGLARGRVETYRDRLETHGNEIRDQLRSVLAFLIPRIYPHLSLLNKGYDGAGKVGLRKYAVDSISNVHNLFRLLPFAGALMGPILGYQSDVDMFNIVGNSMADVLDSVVFASAFSIPAILSSGLGSKPFRQARKILKQLRRQAVTRGADVITAVDTSRLQSNLDKLVALTEGLAEIYQAPNGPSYDLDGFRWAARMVGQPSVHIADGLKTLENYLNAIGHEARTPGASSDLLFGDLDAISDTLSGMAPRLLLVHHVTEDYLNHASVGLQGTMATGFHLPIQSLRLAQEDLHIYIDKVERLNQLVDQRYYQLQQIELKP